MAFETLRAKLELDPSGFKEGIQDAQDDLDGLGSRTERVGQKMQKAGMMMTGAITAPLAAMGAAAVRQTGTFNQAMAESMSVMGDVSERMEEDLRDTAREVATATEHSHQQSARALYFLSSAGLDAAESMEALPAAADFATAGQMRLEEATSILTTTMRAYGREASEMKDITDTLAATVANSNTTMSQMSTAMSQVGPVAASMGISLNETVAAIGAISNAGVQGERAGTALRNVMAQLSDETSTASTQLEKMGVKTKNSEGEMVSMVQLLRRMEAAGVEAGDAAKIFGMEAAPAMAALMEQGGGSLQDFTEEVRRSEGATQDMAETQRNTLNSELRILKDNVADLGIAFGHVLVPSIKTAASSVGDATDRFRGLSDSQKELAVGAALVAGSIGPVIALLGTLGVVAPAVSGGLATLSGWAATTSGAMATASATTSAYATSLLTTLIPASAVGQTSLLGLAGAALTAQVALGPITVPIYAIVAAIGALVGATAGLYVAWNNNVLGIKDSTQAAFQRIKRWFTNAPAWMLVLLGPLGQLYLGWRENLFGIQDITDKVFGFIGDKISWLRDQIDRIPGIGESVQGGQEALQQEIGESYFTLSSPDTQKLEEQLGNAGQSAGKEFGTSFAKSAVESLQTGDVADSLKEELKSVRETKADVDTMDNPDRARALRDEIERLEEQIGKVESADSIADLDEELVAKVAAEEIKSDKREEEFVSDVLTILQERGIDAGGGSEKQGESAPEVMIDATESESSKTKRQNRLSKIVSELKRLREAMLRPGDSLSLSGDLDLDDDVATMDDVEATIERAGRRAENRGYRTY